jgi:hypothetical protein
MVRLLSVLSLTVPLLLAPAGLSFAANPHSGGSTGQPNKSCQDTGPGTTPGNAASAQGSAFNPTGTAGTHYAGQQPQNSKNPKSVAQYDCACFQQSMK